VHKQLLGSGKLLDLLWVGSRMWDQDQGHGIPLDPWQPTVALSRLAAMPAGAPYMHACMPVVSSPRHNAVRAELS
jgi:hypothetical protein